MESFINEQMIERLFGLDRDVKVLAISQAIKHLTGELPIVTRFDDYTEIKFTPDQVKKAQQKLKEMHSAKPGEIRVSYGQIFAPFYLKKYAWWMAGIFGIGFLSGKFLKLF